MEDFTITVIKKIREKAKVRFPSADGTLVAEFYDTLHDAIIVFLQDYRNDPAMFPTVDDAVHWVWGILKNMRLRPGTPEIPVGDDIDVLGPRAGSDARQRPAVVREPVEPLSGLGAAVVIVCYFAQTATKHRGRLTLSEDDVAVLSTVAQYGLNGWSWVIESADWRLIAEELQGRFPLPSPPQQRSAAPTTRGNPRNRCGNPERERIERLQEILYTVRAKFSVIFYVVGGLGPDDAFTSVDRLGAVLAQFERQFRGQNDWSVLRFAACSAFPSAAYARVAAATYDQSIMTAYAGCLRCAPPGGQGASSPAARVDGPEPCQAERLGWKPGGPEPALLLHAVESRASAAFGVPHQHCVLCRCAEHTRGGQR